MTVYRVGRLLPKATEPVAFLQPGESPPGALSRYGCVQQEQGWVPAPDSTGINELSQGHLQWVCGLLVAPQHGPGAAQTAAGSQGAQASKRAGHGQSTARMQAVVTAPVTCRYKSLQAL